MFQEELDEEEMQLFYEAQKAVKRRRELPEKLVIQAFGPYVEKQEIDFSDISSHHLFLIQGETGSGKTMLLDAITFALFGKSSGGQREKYGEAMRSRFASDDIQTFVEFIFSLKRETISFCAKSRGKDKAKQRKSMEKQCRCR